MKFILRSLVMASALLATVEAFAGESAPALDGKTFTGTIINKDGKFADDLVFTNGNFTSTACESQGFTSAPYTATETGKVTKFTATTTNKEGARIEWTGTVTGSMAVAHATQIAKDGKKSAMKYSGHLKPVTKK